MFDRREVFQGNVSLVDIEFTPIIAALAGGNGIHVGDLLRS
jgi:hypothetical protein